MKLGSVDLTTLIAKITVDADFEAQAHNRGVRIVESMPCVVSGNEELLRRAVENVIRNAIRYTQEGTTVDITLRDISDTSNSYAEITVRDHGQGVSVNELPFLFHPFYRVSSARERQTGGSGLGLAITQRAVNFHHGSVAASNAQDGGLIIMMRLPIFS